MSAADAIEAVRTMFVDDVATPLELTTVHDNGPIEAVSDPRARVAIVVDSEQQITMGSAPKFRAIGRMDVQLLAPRERGDADLLSLAQSVIDAFAGESIASPSVRFWPPPSLFGALDFEDAMARRTVRVPFFHDYQQA